MKKLLTLIGVAALLATENISQAGLQVQTGTNAVVVNSTNTFVLTGDVTGTYTNGENISRTFIVANQTTDLSLQIGGFFTNTATGASNISYTVYSSVDGAVWQFATNGTVSVPAASTNWAAAQIPIGKSVPFYALRTLANTNTAIVTGKAGTMYLKAYTKDGI